MIRFEGVTKVYRNGIRGVEGLSFHCRKGETLALVGISGCGKTTTLRMINRLVDLTSGKIFVDGMDIRDYNVVKLRRRMGYVIQSIGLFPHLTVMGNVGLVPELEGWPVNQVRDRVIYLLNMVGLKPDIFMNRYPDELSGGQQQRIGIARALASDPPILLMDEPFGALDPITRQQLLDEFFMLTKEINKTIIFVTHDIFEAVKLADRIAVMREGRVVQIGAPSEIIENPRDAFVMSLLHRHYFQLSLSLIQLKDMMICNVITTSKEDETDFVKRCTYLLDKWRISCLPVIDTNNRYKGFITRASLHDPQNPVLQDYPTLKTNGTVVDALDCFKRNPTIEMVPVLNHEGRLEGLVSRKAIKGYLVRNV